MNDAGKVAFTPKGDYDSTATYEYLDTVVYNGNAYAALKTTTGNQPEDDSEYWALLARGGALVPSATKNTQGVVKLSDSSAVTDSTGLALPATEKNASIEGTLANQISAIKYKLFSYEANGLTAYFRKVGRLIDCYIQGQTVQELATASGYATVCTINDDDFKVHPNCMFIQYVFLNNVHYGQCRFTTETALSIGYTKNMSGTSTNIAEGEYIYIHFQYLSKQ